jgi:hypothetical protein
MSRVNYINNIWHLLKEDGADQPSGQPPVSTPGTPGDPMGDNPGPIPPQGGSPDPNVAAPPSDPNFAPDDVNDDPQAPDIPDQKNDLHFEEWRNQFFKESIKGNSNILIDLINQVRDRELESNQRKFVEDNLQIQFLRQQANVVQASKEIRKNVNEDLDRNNPANSLVKHIDEALQSQRLLVDNFIKITGYLGMKGDLHRKYLAALLGAVQVGSGASNEDIILNDNEYAVNLSTRIASDFGRFDLGTWTLKANDAERFLSDPELKRLENGSPEEREVLRHRIIIDSMVNRFVKRGFILTVVGDDGTLYNIGWDVATCLKASYVSGKLVVRTKNSDNSEVMFGANGMEVSIMDLDIRYVKETGETNAQGKPKKHDVPFIERRDGMLFLVAPLDVLQETANTLQGITVKEIPYQGNPSDLQTLTRCVYSATEMIMRQC